MTDIEEPEDWVLFEAANRTLWYHTKSNEDGGIAELREDYRTQRIYRALCDMIAKHETPPADPNEEAVKRIFDIVLGSYKSERIWDENPVLLAAAVAQYKKERGNG